VTHVFHAAPRRRFRLATSAALFALAGCGGYHAQTVAPAASAAITADETILLLSQLADDSLQGRLVGTPGILKAARIIEAEMRRLRLEPAGDSGYYQRVPAYEITDTMGRTRARVAPSWEALDTIKGAKRFWAANLVGRLRGADSLLAQEHILIDGHYDHLGVAGTPRSQCLGATAADSICNGADDDASGIVAALKIAQAMTRGERPRRTLLFAAMTGEEVPLLGAKWYVDHPALPLSTMAANLEIEMIGRPDSLAGGRGKAWLTGFERTTMGDMLVAAGIPIVADPHPAMQFFRRSDNIALARRGIVAQTLSTYNLHTDYHHVSDEVSKVDGVHMAAVIEAGVRAVRLLADGPRPEWKPGGKP
jgi:hypothetical protein